MMEKIPRVGGQPCSQRHLPLRLLRDVSLPSWVRRRRLVCGLVRSRHGAPVPARVARVRWDSQAACGQPQAPPAAPWLLQPAPTTNHCPLVVMVQGAKAQPMPWFRRGAVGARTEQGHSVTVVTNEPPSLRGGPFLLIPEWPTAPCGPQTAPDVHLTACHMGGCRRGAFRGGRRGGARGGLLRQLLRSACGILPGYCEALGTHLRQVAPRPIPVWHCFQRVGVVGQVPRRTANGQGPSTAERVWCALVSVRPARWSGVQRAWHQAPAVLGRPPNVDLLYQLRPVMPPHLRWRSSGAAYPHPELKPLPLQEPGRQCGEGGPPGRRPAGCRVALLPPARRQIRPTTAVGHGCTLAARPLATSTLPRGGRGRYLGATP